MSAVLENRTAEDPVVNAPSGRPQQRTLSLRLYDRSNRFVQGAVIRAHRVVDALHAGFWLGFLDSHQLKAIVDHHYDETKLFQTAEHNLHGFLPYEKQLIRDHFGDCRSVVVAAAGGGREMIALAEAGVEVDGFDCNLGLVEKCKEFLALAEVSGQILYAAPDQVPSGLQIYDGGIVGWGAFGLIVGRTKRVNFLRDLKSHLRAGSPLFVSVLRRPEGSRYHAWIYRIARTIRFLRRSTESIEPGDELVNSFSHRFSENELRAELRDAGFEVLVVVETHEMYVVART